MLNKTEFFNKFDDESQESVELIKKELTRYGNIINIIDSSDVNGEHRVYEIAYFDHTFKVAMTNGVTTKIIGCEQ